MENIRLFFNFLFGFFIQIAPFSFFIFFLAFHFQEDCQEDFQKKRKKKMFCVLNLILSIESLLFAILTLYIVIYLTPDETRLNIINMVFLGCLIPQIVYYFISFRRQNMEKLFSLFLGATCAVFCASIANLILVLFLPATRSTYYPYSFRYDCVYLSISFFFIGPVYFLVKRFYVPFRKVTFQKKMHYMVFLSGILFVLTVIGLGFLDTLYFERVEDIFILFALFFTIVLIYCIVFLLLHSLYDKFFVKSQLQQLQHTMELSHQQYKSISDKIELSRKFQHDLHHHAIVLERFLKQQQPEEALQYIHDYLTSADTLLANKKYSTNVVINTLVNYYTSLCAEKDILFSFTIKMEDSKYANGDFPVDDTDLVIILGNLLENAMEAAASCQPPLESFIRLRILIRKFSMVIAIDNSFDHTLLVKDTMYQSTKENHTGIGISSIRQVADKYNGGTEFNGNEHVFHVSVMLQFPMK